MLLANLISRSSTFRASLGALVLTAAAASAVLVQASPASAAPLAARPATALFHDAVPASYTVSGIDIASYQHPSGAAINWASVAASKQFVYIKATEGTTFTNSYYAGDLQGALNAGMYAGAYAFGRPDNANAAAQADYLLNVTNYNSAIGGRILPSFLDIETGNTVGLSTCYGLSAAQMSSWIHQFANEYLARAGRLPVIYTSNGFWGACMSGDTTMGSLPLDVAKWSSTPTPLPVSWSGSSWAFWQYADDESVPGITGLVDGDVFNGTIGQLTAFAAARPRAQTKTVITDVDGNGKADLVTVNGDSVFAALSTGSTFGIPTRWSTAVFYGGRDTLSGDIDGDGKADLVAVNVNSVYVELSTGKAFGLPVQWSSSLFYGVKATYLADVNGDGKADLVAVNGDSVWVMLSTGSSFAPPVQWSSVAFLGNKATLVADVNGDGKADIIAVNNDGAWVLPSTGAAFGPPTQFASVGLYGAKATLAGDIDGDKKFDLIAVNGNSVWTESSTGTAFGPPTLKSSAVYAGTMSILTGDVTGDKSSDLVAVNPDSVWIMAAGATGSGPSAFGSPQRWW